VNEPSFTVGNQKLHATVYAYGARIDPGSLDLARKHLRKAHDLYNNIIAEIRSVLDEERTTTIQLAGPGARALSDRIEALSASFKNAKANNNKNEMKRIASERRECYAQLGPLLKTARREHKEILDPIRRRVGDVRGASTYTLRCNAVDDGLSGDTASYILDAALDAYKASMKTGRYPRFRRFDEISTESLLITAHRAGGVPVEKIMSGDYAPAQISGTGKIRSLKFRIGQSKNNEWATGTVEMHRDLPQNAGIASAALIRKRIGLRETWQIQFVCVGVTPEPQAPKKTVALHIGWAKRDGTRLVAAAFDGKTVQRIELPEAIERAMDNADAARSLADNLIKEKWPSIRDELKQVQINDSEQLADQLARLCATPTARFSALKMQAIVDNIRAHAGGVFSANVESFTKELRGYVNRATFGRRKAINTRAWFYRNVAANLARNYDVCIIAEIDLQDAAQKVNEHNGEKNEFTAEARYGRVVVALSELEAAVKNAVSKRDGMVIYAKGARTTRSCAQCGSNKLYGENDDEQKQTCADCGNETNRKINAAINLYRSAATTDVINQSRIKFDDEFLQASAKRAARLEKMHTALVANRGKLARNGDSIS